MQAQFHTHSYVQSIHTHHACTIHTHNQSLKHNLHTPAYSHTIKTHSHAQSTHTSNQINLQTRPHTSSAWLHDLTLLTACPHTQPHALASSRAHVLRPRPHVLTLSTSTACPRPPLGRNQMPSPSSRPYVLFLDHRPSDLDCMSSPSPSPHLSPRPLTRPYSREVDMCLHAHTPFRTQSHVPLTCSHTSHTHHSRVFSIHLHINIHPYTHKPSTKS